MTALSLPSGSMPSTHCLEKLYSVHTFLFWIFFKVSFIVFSTSEISIWLWPLASLKMALGRGSGSYHINVCDAVCHCAIFSVTLRTALDTGTSYQCLSVLETLILEDSNSSKVSELRSGRPWIWTLLFLTSKPTFFPPQRITHDNVYFKFHLSCVL